MTRELPESLIATLHRLGLATSEQVVGVADRVERLAGELPRFDSVWLDALADAQILTRFQVAEVEAGRGESLRVGPYLLCEPIPCTFAASFRAVHVETRSVVQLTVAEFPEIRRIKNSSRHTQSDASVQSSRHTPCAVSHQSIRHTPCAVADGTRSVPNTLGCGGVLGQLQDLVARSQPLAAESMTVVIDCGADEARVWVASASTAGRTVAQWMMHHGRFAPEVALAIARAMAADLAALESAGICHGDLGTSSVLLADTGSVVLLQPGVRGIFRPAEGYAYADREPAAYETLAPERVEAGTPPDTASDIYACGCLWWHMLCGRPPLAGGDSLGKLRAAQAAAIGDVRQLADDVDPALAATISACLVRDSRQRPESMTRLAERLGQPSHGDRDTLRRAIRGAQRSAHFALAEASPLARSERSRKRLQRMTLAAALTVLAAAAVAWPIWSRQSSRGTSPSGAIASTSPRGGAKTPAVPSEIVAKRSAKSPSRPISDPDVLATGYSAPLATKANNRDDTDKDLVLSPDVLHDARRLVLKPGQKVRAESGKRARVAVPFEGMTIDADETAFENIDFIAEAAADPGRSEAATLCSIGASQVSFRGCRFLPHAARPREAVAIRWLFPRDRNSAVALPSGRLRLQDCMIETSQAIDSRTAGGVVIEARNLLFVGSGPLVHLERCPATDEPLRITLDQVTLRETGPVLACPLSGSGEGPGQITVQANRCVFALAAGHPLIDLRGAARPESFLKKIQWDGQGSLVVPQAVIAAWRQGQGAAVPLEDDAVAIAGLVRSTVQFTGPREAGPSASRATSWQAPLLSPDAPGIDPDRLPVGRR